MMPLLVVSSASTALSTTRSLNGLIVMLGVTSPKFKLSKELALRYPEC
jgi:hypothetical protein